MKTYIVKTVETTTYKVNADTHEDAIRAVCEGNAELVDDTQVDMFADETEGESK
jgi:hypothetical protein